MSHAIAVATRPDTEDHRHARPGTTTNAESDEWARDELLRRYVSALVRLEARDPGFDAADGVRTCVHCGVVGRPVAEPGGWSRCRSCGELL
jgi:hypothetical protein